VVQEGGKEQRRGRNGREAERKRERE